MHYFSQNTIINSLISFDIKDGKLAVRAQDLLVPQFEAIYSHDKSRDKERALLLLRYVYSMKDANSAYADMDEWEREPFILRSLFGSPDYEFPKGEQKLIKDALTAYEKLNETAELRFKHIFNKLIDDIRKEIEKVTPEFVRHQDARTGKVTFASNIALVTAASTDLEELLEARDKLEARIEGKKSSGNIKGKKSPSLLESRKIKIPLPNAQPAA